MRVFERIHGFDLNDQPVLHQNVDAESCAVKGPVEFYIDRLLPVYLQPAPLQFSSKHDLIYAFQLPGAQLSMNENGGIYDVRRNRVDLDLPLSASPRLRENLNSPSRKLRGRPS